MKWMDQRQVATRQRLSDLIALPNHEQHEMGLGHTLAEIWQQPELWRDTAQRMMAARPVWEGFVGSVAGIVLTGSGSSCFVGKCAAPALQQSLSIPVIAVESGEILMEGAGVLPPVRPLLLVSFARSGDSPESWGLIQHLLESEEGVNHLVITCNPNGRLAQMWSDGGSCLDPRVKTVVLDERACDRSLVMTSSFTSMLVAALGLTVREPAMQSYFNAVEKLASGVSGFLESGLAPLEDFPYDELARLFAVGSGPLHGAAHEVALKVLEMSDGLIITRAETCLGLRHGPMCGLGPQTPLFMALSSDPLRRAYQVDLIRDVNDKRLRCRKILAGVDIPADLVTEGDVTISLDCLRGLDDEWLAVAGVVIGQVLGFLACLSADLRPDEPAVGDSISRVVGGFTVHNLLKGARG